MEVHGVLPRSLAGSGHLSAGQIDERKIRAVLLLEQVGEDTVERDGLELGEDLALLGGLFPHLHQVATGLGLPVSDEVEVDQVKARRVAVGQLVEPELLLAELQPVPTPSVGEPALVHRVPHVERLLVGFALDVVAEAVGDGLDVVGWHVGQQSLSPCEVLLGVLVVPVVIVVPTQLREPVDDRQDLVVESSERVAMKQRRQLTSIHRCEVALEKHLHDILVVEEGAHLLFGCVAQDTDESGELPGCCNGSGA